jgi:hypothetical protein
MGVDVRYPAEHSDFIERITPISFARRRENRSMGFHNIQLSAGAPC